MMELKSLLIGIKNTIIHNPYHQRNTELKFKTICFNDE